MFTKHFTIPRPAVQAARLLLICLLTGGLASCASSVSPGQAEIHMEVQYYDPYGNYIEIPTVSLSDEVEPGDDLVAMNNELTSIETMYSPIIREGHASSTPEGSGNVCLLYPTVTDRFISLLLYQKWSVTDLTSGHVSSYIYDLKNARRFTLEDALHMAGLTESQLVSRLKDQRDPADSLPLLEGFRIAPSGRPVFYLSVTGGDAQSTPSSPEGAEQLYIYEAGSFTVYDQYAPGGFPPLVPAEECEQLNPPLWYQWNFTTGEPQGGFTLPPV